MAMVIRCGVDPVVNLQCVPLAVSWAHVFRKLIVITVHYTTKELHNCCCNIMFDSSFVCVRSLIWSYFRVTTLKLLTDDDIDDDELFLWHGWPGNSQKRISSRDHPQETFIIVNFQHAEVGINPDHWNSNS